jgi:hypothetical protein
MPVFYNHPLSVINNFPLSDLTGATSTCGDTRLWVIYATPTQLCATSHRGATMEGLCAPPGSPESSFTHVVGRHMLLGKFCDEAGFDDDQTEDHQGVAHPLYGVAPPLRGWPPIGVEPPRKWMSHPGPTPIVCEPPRNISACPDHRERSPPQSHKGSCRHGRYAC